MAISVHIPNSELTKALMKFKKYPLDKQKVIRHELKEMAEAVDKKQKSRLQALGRVSGKNYSSMWQQNILTQIGPETITIHNEHKASEFFEYGTKPHKIRVKNAKVLATRTEYIGGGFTNNGKEWTVFGKEVSHPGTKATPFFYKEVQKASRPFVKRLNELLNIK